MRFKLSRMLIRLANRIDRPKSYADVMARYAGLPSYRRTNIGVELGAIADAERVAKS